MIDLRFIPISATMFSILILTVAILIYRIAGRYIRMVWRAYGLSRRGPWRIISITPKEDVEIPREQSWGSGIMMISRKSYLAVIESLSTGERDILRFRQDHPDLSFISTKTDGVYEVKVGRIPSNYWRFRHPITTDSLVFIPIQPRARNQWERAIAFFG